MGYRSKSAVACSFIAAMMICSMANAQLVTPINKIVSLDTVSSENLVVGDYNILHCVYADRPPL